VLGARHSDRNWQSQLLAYPAADRFGNISWRTTEMGAARNVGKTSSIEIRSKSGV